MNKCLIVLPLCLLASCATYQNKKSAINVLGGVRSLDNDDFEDLGNPVTYGVDALIGVTHGGLGIEGAYLRSEDDDDGDVLGGSGDAELVTDEVSVGLRNTWNCDAALQPYIGAGAAWTSVNLETDTFDDDDSVVAPYLHGGLGWQFGSFQIGIDGRILFGSDFDLNDNSTDLDYYQLAGTLGFTW